jgi:SAM-dependent methyltransferase
VWGVERILDVGCGPGALTAELTKRLGASAVTAIDPTEAFVAAVRERSPGVDVRQASAEELPFPAGEFDAALAQLVVHFMNDPVAGLAEMGRVTSEDGVVAACVWDHAAGGRGPLSLFWEAARELDPGSRSESGLAGTGEGDLAKLRVGGLQRIEDGELTFDVEHETFEDWWEPYTLGVGPVGVYVRRARRRAQAGAPRALPHPAAPSAVHALDTRLDRESSALTAPVPS